MDVRLVPATIDGIPRRMPYQEAKRLFDELAQGLAEPVMVSADRKIELVDGCIGRDELADFLRPMFGDQLAARSRAGRVLGKIREARIRHRVQFVITCLNCGQQLPVAPESRRLGCDHEHSGLLKFNAASLIEYESDFLSIEYSGYSDRLKAEFSAIVRAIKNSLPVDQSV